MIKPGELIVELLQANSDLTDLVDPDNIFPYIANENTNLPLIVYTIDSINPEYTKDGLVGDMVKFSISSFTDNYSDLQNIVSAVRDSLELEHGEDTQRIIVTGQSEGYLDGVFGNKLSFEIFIINN